MRMVTRAATAAHRLIAKPCETEALIRVIERSCALQELGYRVELNRHAMGASVLPSVPRVCAELSELLASGTAGAGDAGRIIEQDMGIAAKVLQLANSAYFGRRTPVVRISEAVAYVGLDALRAFVLQAAAVQEFQVGRRIPGFDLEGLQRHCGRVARLSAAIGGEIGLGNEVFTAGLLHDVGLLVMASQDGQGLASTIAAARESGRPLHEIERERYGLTHGELGAHLLALWGLPHVVIETVAGHHGADWLAQPFDAIAVVHVANALVEELEFVGLPDCLPATVLDGAYLEQAGVVGALPRWRALAEREFLAETDQADPAAEQ
jgi:putative nucleotidyltransferase with HDIG domain